MRALLDALIRLRFLLLFIALEAISMALIHRHTFLRDNVVFTSAGRVTAAISRISSSVTDYFGLRNENERLVRQNAALKSEIYRLRYYSDMSRIDEISADSMIAGDIVVARVINNVLDRSQNYVTIDKGKRDGLTEGMGVCESGGIVGVVYRTSEKYALVMPLLNTNTKISCNVLGLDSFGFLRWNAEDLYHALLTDMPSQSGISVGDTVVTSGYSESFPKGLTVGYVESVSPVPGESPVVSVRLAVDFGALGFVYVCKGIRMDELPELDKEE